MIAEELQFLEAGALAKHLTTLIAGGATIHSVLPTVKSWYLILYTGA